MMWVIALLAIALCTLGLVWWKVTRRRLNAGARKRMEEAWRRVDLLDDPVKKILEADNVLHMTLTMLRYEGGLGDQLKKAGARIRNIADVWQAHKLRNRIAHEPGVKVSDQEAQRAVDTIRRAIDAL